MLGAPPPLFGKIPVDHFLWSLPFHAKIDKETSMGVVLVAYLVINIERFKNPESFPINALYVNQIIPEMFISRVIENI